MSESNLAVIREAYEGFARGDMPAVFAAFDAAIKWHVPGHSPLSGDFTGHDEIGGFFRRTMDLSEVRSALRCTTYSLIAISSSHWSRSTRNAIASPHRFPRYTSGK